jgi:hypothetical protein
VLTDALDQIEKGGANSSKQGSILDTGAAVRRGCRATRAIETAPARSRSPAMSSSALFPARIATEHRGQYRRGRIARRRDRAREAD